MQTPSEAVSSLQHYCQLTTDPMDALKKCCQHLQETFMFDTVFLAAMPNVQETPQPLPCFGNEVLMDKAFYRAGIEDRMALLKLPSKSLSDITGKPAFSASGTLRIQKPSSGIFAAMEQPGKFYLFIGFIHQDARKYEGKMEEDLAAIWRGWRPNLLPIAQSVIAKKSEAPPPKKPDQPVEDSVVLDNLQISVSTVKASASASAGSPPVDILKRSTDMVDAATRLYNRNYFLESLSIEVERARRYQRNLSVMIIGVTALKPVRGDGDWDKIAVVVAEILVKALRRVDIICRYERHKFAILMPDTPSRTLGIIAKRIFKLFRQAMGEDPAAYLNLSTAAFPQHAEHDIALLQKAEEMLAQAVAAGPNKAILTD